MNHNFRKNAYTIKEMSLLNNIPASTLRYYEDIGLLINVERTESNQRIYTDEHIRRLDSINCFKSTGMSITKIKEFFLHEKDVENNIDQIIALVTKHEENTQQKIAKIQNDLLHIQRKLRYYQGIKVAIDNGTKWPDWAETALE